MPKATTPTSSHKRRHNPLEDDLLATGVLKNKTGKPSKKGGEVGDQTGAQQQQGYVDAKASRQILAMSRSLIDEDLQEKASNNAVSGPSAFDFDPSRFGAGGESDLDDDAEQMGMDEDAWGDEDDVVEEIEVDADDLETFNKFVAPTMKEDPLLTHGWDGKLGEDGDTGGDAQGTNLADLILAKIAQKESALQGGEVEDVNPVEEEYELPPKVVEVYSKYVCREHLVFGRKVDLLTGLISGSG